MEGFIVLHRKMLDWEWADDPGTVSLWIHLLLRANYEKGKWRGIVIKRGQLVTSIESLSLQTGLTKKQIRTRLDRLVESGCLGRQTANNYTLLTICKYGDYQNIPNNEGKQRAIKGQQTTRITIIIILSHTLSARAKRNFSMRLLRTSLGEKQSA